MGLTRGSVGRGALDGGLSVRRQPGERVVALAGMPNVGKSTVFNALTGLHQHTGNWTGKTVANACGRCRTAQGGYVLVDIPGTYSLSPHSAEEEVARDLLCFGEADAAVVVCDATCLERGLPLALQIMETGLPTVVCVNLMDEARRLHIRLDLPALSARLGVPVVGVSARRARTLGALTDALDALFADGARPCPAPIGYPPAIEDAVRPLTDVLQPHAGRLSARFLALRLLERAQPFTARAEEDPAVSAAAARQRAALRQAGFSGDAFGDALAAAAAERARACCADTVDDGGRAARATLGRADRLLTGRLTGYPVMLLLLALVLWLTVEGANLPSELLSRALFWGQERLTALCAALHAPDWLHGALVLGAYRVLAWVVSVMLPPMAIFFPLFTLLEDAGYLPRIAYVLDRPFHRCRACGKQALTMCMGFGCNAAGVTGCRIIDSPRERLLAMLTNAFVPCNGRFPLLLTLCAVFLAGPAAGGSLLTTAAVTGAVLLGVLATFAVTRLLAATVLRGVPSSFTLELPPYRRPQIGRVLWRSLFDRTVFVLGRAAAVAAPAGLALWVLANVQVGGASLLAHAAGALDPVGRFLGMDGAILLAFILGFPANEIVLPIALMVYLSQGTLTGMTDLTALRQVLLDNGWTPVTALCTGLFALFHFPCSTTLLTVRRESGSRRWTLLSAVLPTALGVVLCAAVAAVARFFG